MFRTWALKRVRFRRWVGPRSTRFVWRISSGWFFSLTRGARSRRIAQLTKLTVLLTKSIFRAFAWKTTKSPSAGTKAKCFCSTFATWGGPTSTSSLRAVASWPPVNISEKINSLSFNPFRPSVLMIGSSSIVKSKQDPRFPQLVPSRCVSI